MSSSLLTKKEVCELLQVSTYTIDRLHKLGLLPRVQISSRTIRFRIEDLKKLIERRTLE